MPSPVVRRGEPAALTVGPLVIEPKAQSDRLACAAATASSATLRAVVRRLVRSIGEGLRCRRCRPAVLFGIVVRLPVFLTGGLSGC